MKVFIRLLPIIGLTLLVIGFFLPLFWPLPQLFIAPDFTLSDILQFHYPLKFLYSEALKQNQLPLWTDLVGTGFPLIGESQVQALSLINLILFKCFPLITAFNLQYVVAFLGLTLGMYLVAREFGWSKLTSIYCAIIYGFSGLHIVKIFHLNVIQALSYVPLMFWILLRMQKNKASKLWILLPLLGSQQILQGHYQYVFMTYIFFGLYFYLTWWRTEKKDHGFLIKKLLIIGLLTLGLSMGQLIPSAEYFLKSGGREGLDKTIAGSFNLPHLLQFFSPYILGDIRSGSYPASHYGVSFIETFLYIGLIPILLAIASLWHIKKNPWIRTCWISIGILFLFVFEKNSPIYFLFSFPPFSWFRVYSRFLAYIAFLLVLLSGYMFELLVKKEKQRIPSLLLIFLFTTSCLDVLSFASSYHPTIPVWQIQTKPDLYKPLTGSFRIASFLDTTRPWQNLMQTEGWKHPNDYITLATGKPNYTILHNQPSLSIYAGFIPVKQGRMLNAAFTQSAFDDTRKEATLSAQAINTLRLQNTKYLLSLYHIKNPEVSQIGTYASKNSSLDPTYIFSLSNVKPMYYLTNRYKTVQHTEDYSQEVDKPDALISYDAFLTTDRVLSPSSDEGTVSILVDASTKKEFLLTAPSDMFFVASIYLYPGWEATLDGKSVPINPANLSSMGIFIPKGTHTLTLRFVPKSILIGIGISGITFLFYLWLITQLFRRALR